jgi:hypothetical protein
MKDSQGVAKGVAGSVEEVAEASLSAQPLCALNWSPDREGLFCCGALDQCVRVGSVTKLYTL